MKYVYTENCKILQEKIKTKINGKIRLLMEPGRLNIKISILPKAIYRFNAIHTAPTFFI